MSKKFLHEHAVGQYGFFAGAKIRRSLHELGSSGIDFYDAAFKLLDIKPTDKLLDIGTGDGFDMLRIAKEYGPALQVGLEPPDDEAGNLEDFENKFVPLHMAMDTEGVHNIQVVPGFGQDMPFRNDSFTKVMAAHSLYEMPDWQKALTETRRVLEPDGLFLVITNGDSNRKRLHDYLKKMSKSLGSEPPQPFSSRFNYHMAEHELPKYFKVLTKSRYTDTLEINHTTLPTYLAAIDTYRASFAPRIINDGRWNRIRKEVVEHELESEIDAAGVAYDTIDIGAILCQNAYAKRRHNSLGRIGLAES
jgi:SAM-dependent methyltransferase